MAITSDVPPELVELLRANPRTAALTGAGVSAASGIPTFRDAQTGLWAQYDPLQLATPEAFNRDPDLIWQWYRWRRELIAKAHPNPGHRALASLEHLLDEFTLVTQNVDGFHRAAGSRRVLELHGDINRTVCSRDRTRMAGFEESDAAPRCTRCGAPGRPDVVWFGEALPLDALQGAFEAAQACELFLSIGTSTAVEPAASLPFVALEAGATVVEINTEPTSLSRRVHFGLAGEADVLLPRLVSEAFGQRV